MVVVDGTWVGISSWAGDGDGVLLLLVSSCGSDSHNSMV